MDFAITIFGVLAGVGLGLFGGYRIGAAVRGRRGAYWALNAAAVLFSAVLNFAGLVMGWHWLAFSAIGLMGGSITGLKYGYAESIGIWRVFDSWTGGDEDLRPPEDPHL